jgi:hypothetical protein
MFGIPLRALTRIASRAAAVWALAHASCASVSILRGDPVGQSGCEMSGGGGMRNQVTAVGQERPVGGRDGHCEADIRT